MLSCLDQYINASDKHFFTSTSQLQLLKNMHEEIAEIAICKIKMSSIYNTILNTCCRIKSCYCTAADKPRTIDTDLFHLFLIVKTRTGKRILVEKMVCVNITEKIDFQRDPDKNETIQTMKFGIVPPKPALQNTQIESPSSSTLSLRKYFYLDSSIHRDKIRRNQRLEKSLSATPVLTLRSLIEHTIDFMGAKFYTYCTKTNNCQDFVMAILNSNGLNDNYDSFVNQNTVGMLQNLNGVSSVINIITGIAGVIVSDPGIVESDLGVIDTLE